MFDLRPVGYVIGLLVTTLGATMLLPMLVDIAEGRDHWPVFLESAILTSLAGGLIALACANGVRDSLSIQQAFLLTTGVWVVLPLFGSLPLMRGATALSFTDAYFEAMSGITTTGSTVISGLDELPGGILLWRGILQWLGGLGIVIVAIIFLPVMRVGGMQFFRSEGFDTFGKVLPRTLDISRGLLVVYFGLSGLCALSYLGLGMDALDAVVHAMTTISTGGFSTSDSSFAAFPGGVQYAASVFMLLGAMPFVRLMQATYGEPEAIWRDSQIRVFIYWVGVTIGILVAYEIVVSGTISEQAVRDRLFNGITLFTGTGYGSTDVTAWGPMPFTVLIIVGMIGGCTGSTVCSIKVFRYQILLRALQAQILRIGGPHRLVSLKLDGRPIDEDLINSVMFLFSAYVIGFGGLAVALSLVGLPFLEAVTSAWTAIFNVGPAFGEMVGATGSLEAYPDSAKWIMSFGMLLGRLEIIAVIVLLLPVFWRS